MLSLLMSKIQWNKTTDVGLPKESPFLAYFRDEIGVCEFCDDDKNFHFISEPAYSWGTTRISKKFSERITHWAEFPDKPIEEKNNEL